jgi:hypothetical protein
LEQGIHANITSVEIAWMEGHRLPLAAVSSKNAEAKLRLRPAMTERVSILIESGP